MTNKTKHRQQPAEIAVLAGGLSTRMGTDKASLVLAGKSLLAHAADAARETGLPVRVIRHDLIPRRGPLGGVHTALTQTKARAVLFLSCDMPFVTSQLLREMLELFEAAGRPLFTDHAGRPGFPFILPRTALPKVRALLELKQASLRELAEELNAERLSHADPRELLNLNTPADLAQARRRVRGVKPAVLSVSGLTIRRGKTDLVSDFSWTVQRGQHWVILGANGSGKTSLLSALLGYLTATAGEMSLLGEVYGGADWRELRNKIGLVSSSIRQMMPENEPAWITVASGRLGMIDYWGTPGKADKAAALRLLRQVDCAYLTERPWAVLSQGERQRVLIGRALMARPALLILDEPCAGLDPAAREHFLGFLERLGRGQKAPALVLVTHHVEEIMPVFTHALLLKEGARLAEGPIREVLTSGNLSEAFATATQLTQSEGRYQLRVQKNPRLIL